MSNVFLNISNLPFSNKMILINMINSIIELKITARVKYITPRVCNPSDSEIKKLISKSVPKLKDI